MALTEAQVNAMELERVLPKIALAFEYDDKFFTTIEKRPTEKVSNRTMRAPIDISPGGAFQYFDPDGGDLGRGSGPETDKALINAVFVAEAIEYTKLAQWATDSDRKSIANGVRRLTTNSMLELRRQMDAQLMQPGTGVLGVVTTDVPAGGENVITLTTDGFGARLMRKKQPVQVFDTTLATLRGSGTISFWDVANKVIRISPQIAGVVATDKIVAAGLAAPASLPAILGVPYHHSNASTGTWLGFNRAITPEIRSNRVNAGGAGLSLPLPRLAINAIENRVGIDEDAKLFAWMHPCQVQAYEQIGQQVSVIHKQPKEEALNMYFSNNMQMAGAPVKRSQNWDKKRIDFVNGDVWGRAEILPIGFYVTDGRKIFEIRGPSGGVATADIFYLVNGVQFFVTNPAATAYIDNLLVPAGY